MNLQQHEANWRDCTACPLCENRFQVVLQRGNAIKDVDCLFIGEAPGLFENVVGFPFVGPAGRKLKHILSLVQLDREQQGLKKVTYSITNVVACFPKGDSSIFRPPLKLEIQACAPRLTEWQQITKPCCLVLLGEIATENLALHPSIIPLPSISVYHPSYIIRNETKELELTLDVAATLINFFEDVL